VKAAILPAIIAFVVVFAVGSNLRGADASPPQPTVTPFVALPPVKCAIPEPDCTTLAQAFLQRVVAQNPGKTVSAIAVVDRNSFEACFTDGSCFGESGAVVPAPGQIITAPPQPVPAITPVPGG
jgi:hypothetical protein